MPLTHETQPISRSGDPVRRRRLKLAILVVALVAAGISARILLIRGRTVSVSHVGSTGSPARLTSANEVVRVEIVHPERGGLRRYSTQTGTVQPFQQANLFAKVSGYLKWQEVDIGSHVKKGEVLAIIDDPEAVKEANRAAAALKQAKAQVAQMNARVETAEADALAAEAAVTKAKASIGGYVSKRKYREKELARYRDLRSRQAVPQQVVDEYEDHAETAVAEERTAEAELESAKALLASAKAKVEQTKADLLEAKATVEVTDEVLAKDKVVVDYTTITSPYDGVITLRNFFVGDFIRSAAEGNERPLLTVERTDKMRVVTFVPDRDVPLTDVGDDATVTLDALPGQRFEGKVSRFSYSEDSESRTMRTEIDLENPDGRLRDGMYGLASILLAKGTAHLTIPSGCQAGQSEAGKAKVFVIRQGRAHQVEIRVGIDDGIRVEVVAGLDAKDAVIVDQRLVLEGTPVMPEVAPQVASVTSPVR
jgi:RND family efflux transporter MFP subunit